MVLKGLEAKMRLTQCLEYVFKYVLKRTSVFFNVFEYVLRCCGFGCGRGDGAGSDF